MAGRIAKKLIKEGNNMRIGVVNSTRLLDESARGKELSAKLQAIAGKWLREVQAVEKSVTDLREKISRSDATTTEEVRFRLRRDLRLSELELRHKQECGQLEVEATREHYREQLLRQAQLAAEKIATESGIDVVLDSVRSGLLHAAPATDLTDAVLGRLAG